MVSISASYSSGGNTRTANRCVPLDRYEANLRTLAGRIAELGGLMVLQTTCPVVPGRDATREPHLPAYMEVVRAVAAGCGLPLVDHRVHWECQAQAPELWMSDAIHPNVHGHRAIARHLCESLGIFDPARQTGRLNIP